MQNSGTFKNIIIAILIAVAGYFSYSAYNAEDQLISQTAEIKNLNDQIAKSDSLFMYYAGLLTGAIVMFVTEIVLEV